MRPTRRLPLHDQIPQPRANVDIIRAAGLARIHNIRFVLLLRLRIPDADFGPAFGILVRVSVGGLAHHGRGDGDDGVVVVGVEAAGADAGGVGGHIACVGEG